MQDRILWIVPKWPLPMQDGSRVATCALLEGVTKKNVVVDLLAFAGSDEKIDLEEARDKLGLRNIFVIRREATLPSKRALLKTFLKTPFLPITFAKYGAPDISLSTKVLLNEGNLPEKIESSMQDQNLSWNTIVHEGLHTAAYSIKNGGYRRYLKEDIRLIYRAQNCESDLWIQRFKQEKNPLLKVFLFFQALLVKRFERSVLECFGGVAAVSAEDISSFKKIAPCSRSVVVPIGRNFSKILPFTYKAKVNLLFVGRLDWLPNKEGLSWFLENVWGKVSEERSDLHLKIVGSGDGAWLKRFSYLPELDFLGRVDDLTVLYEESCGVIVPVFYGSGTRVKVIEAASYGRACIGTALGVAAGLDLKDKESFCCVESREEWIEFLLSFNCGDVVKIGECAFYKLRERFDLHRAADKFCIFLEELQKK